MVEFPLNMDDGEFWFLPNIFVNIVLPASPHTANSTARPAQYLATLSSLQYQRTTRGLYSSVPYPEPVPSCPQTSFTNILEIVKHDGRGSLLNHLPLENHGVNGGARVGQRLPHHGTAPGLLTRSHPSPEVPFPLMPSIRKAGIYQEGGGRVLKWQQEQNYLQTRVFPFQESGFGYGFKRQSGGTGVFHPRIFNATNTTEVQNKQASALMAGRRNRQSDQLQPRNSMENVEVSEQEEETCNDLPPGLPQHWPY